VKKLETEKEELTESLTAAQDGAAALESAAHQLNEQIASKTGEVPYACLWPCPGLAVAWFGQVKIFA
jgi:hypothetical protein